MNLNYLVWAAWLAGAAKAIRLAVFFIKDAMKETTE